MTLRRKIGYASLSLLAVAAAASVIVPNLLATRSRCDHHPGEYAVGALRGYYTAQLVFGKGGYGRRAADNRYAPGAAGRAETYANIRNDYAFPFSDLYYVTDGQNNPRGLISESMARASTPDKAWNSHIFLQGRVDKPNPDTFDLFATPAEYGVGGRNTFYINQQGRVRQADLGHSLTPEEAKQLDPMTDPAWIDS